MCKKCGCNTCDTKKPALILNESVAPRGILSEGLSYHLDANKPLTEHLYRAGSTKYFDLWAEARSYYSRGIIDITNEDDLSVLTETNLGHFGMFEGKKVPLDFPMLDEEVNNRDLDNAVYRLENVYKYLDIEYKETRRGEKYVQINYIPVTSPQSQNPEFVNVRYNNDEDLEIIKNRLDLPMLDEGTYEEGGEDEKFMPKNKFADGGGVYDNVRNFKIGDYFYETPSQIGKNRFYKITSIDRFDVKADDYTYEVNKDTHLIPNKVRQGYGGVSSWTRGDFEYKVDTNQISQYNQGDLSGYADGEINEEAKKKLNKPMRDTSGGKAYKVYVKDPKTGNIKTVRFGSGGLRAKINDKKARNAFAARHKCSTRNDKTKASYWSCRLPRYAKLLGLKSSFSGFW
jgi:5-hydroxyisourate hydrolase-like protein (transthyretin family)